MGPHSQKENPRIDIGYVAVDLPLYPEPPVLPVCLASVRYGSGLTMNSGPPAVKETRSHQLLPTRTLYSSDGSEPPSPLSLGFGG